MTCIIWQGKKDKAGYGKISGTKYAHRIIYEQIFGPIPKGFYVCHSCDNPSCVNPEHLFLGTPKDNAQDKVKKGRQITRDQFKSVKIKTTDFDYIKTSTKSCRELAKEFNCSHNAIHLVRKKLTEVKF